MVRHFYFKDRDGQTQLPEELKKGLIPKNIQTVGELDEYEEANIMSGLQWLEKKSHKNFLKYEFWLKLHKKLFSDVWAWAGQIRKHELDNPHFKHPHQIWPAIKKLEDDINFWINDKTMHEQEISARIHERLLTIHPFSNGNGRFSRILIEYICQKFKWTIPTWGQSLASKPSARRQTYIHALDHARNTQKYDLLIQFIFQ